MKMVLPKTCKRNPSKNKQMTNSANTKLMLKIVNGEVTNTTTSPIKSPMMPKPIQIYDFDIVKTRRLIINNCNEGCQPFAAPKHNYAFITNNEQNIHNSQGCMVQFSNSLAARPLIPGFSNTTSTPIQKSQVGLQQIKLEKRFCTEGLYNVLPKYIRNNNHQILPNVVMNNDDDIMCLDSSQADESVTSMSSNDDLVITIDDSINNSHHSVTTRDPIQDISKFEIIIENPNFIQSKQENVNQDDSVICIDSEDTAMELTDHSIKEHEPSTKNECSVITIDDDDDFKRVPVPRCKLSLSRPKKYSLIHKKKNTALSSRKATRTLITFEEPRVVPEPTKPSTTEPLNENGLDKHVSNIYNSEPVARNGLREIIIDGNNVALGHTNGESFSVEGLKIVIDYFRERGHKVRAFVPQFRTNYGRSTNPEQLRQLVKEKLVVLTPSRAIMGRRITPYDDRFIIQYATSREGIIVSSDCYRDLIAEKPEWRDTIENRLLMPTWIDNILMFPDDPLGRFGPNLTDFLKFPVT